MKNTTLIPLLTLVSFSRAAFHKQKRAVSQGQISSIISGSLSPNQVLTITPVAQSCFSKYSGNFNLASPNAARCADITAKYPTNQLEDQPGFYSQPNWASCQARQQDCELDWTNPSNLAATQGQTCYQGSVPPFGIAVKSASDVQAALQVAKQLKLPVVVKSTGHDYKGRSAAPNSLMLWTYNLKNITFTASFAPVSCSGSHQAITVGAGVVFDEVYQFADTRDLTFVGGLSATVSPSGGYLAGGHSPLSNTLGLAVDNLLETKVVTPDGRYLTASRCQNPDLFFAIAGGSPSTFGVVIESTFKVYPKVTPNIVQVVISAPNATAIDQLSDIVVDNSLSWVKNTKLGGVVALNPVAGGLNIIVMGSITASLEEVQAAMKPLTDFAAALGAFTVMNQAVSTKSWYDAFKNYYTTAGEAEPFSLDMAIASRLVPDTLFSSDSSRATLKTAMRRALDITTPANPAVVYGAPIQILFTTPYSATAAGGTSETPAWRNAIWHSAFASAWLYNATSTQVSAAYQQVNGATQLLRNLAPGSGAYQNEAYIHEPAYLQTFWGQRNADRLQTIKSKYDPKNILSVWQGIGFNPADPRFSCYPAI